MKLDREHLYEIIFEADTRAGKLFDVILLMAIVLSILAVMLESVDAIEGAYGDELRVVEWVFTGLFTVEYLLRITCVQNPWRYARSFYGIVDLLAVLPSYLGLILAGGHTFIVIRVLRLLRVFRVFKLARFLGEANVLVTALRASRAKIIVFLGSVMSLVVIMGTAMYILEAGRNGFDSIPDSMYWAIVTMTTVGYGDIVPGTVGGKVLASMLMIMGYGIIAVPTGIVSAELVHQTRRDITTQVCPSCLSEGHDRDAKHCKLCGVKL